MKNFKESAYVVNLTAAATINSGDFVFVNAMAYGVAQTAAASGASVPVVPRGVFNLPKATGETWAIGDLLYWDNSAKKFTKTSTSNTVIGSAQSVQASGDTTGDVWIR